MLESVWKLLKELFAFRDTQKMTPKLAFLTLVHCSLDWMKPFFFAHSVNWSKLLKKTPLVWTLNWITKVKLEMNCWSNLVIVTETFLLVFGYRGQQMQQVYFVRYDKAKETTTEPLLEKVWTSYQQQTTLLSATSRGRNVVSIVMKWMK